jgi:hypothetical protein
VGEGVEDGLEVGSKDEVGAAEGRGVGEITKTLNL